MNFEYETSISISDEAWFMRAKISTKINKYQILTQEWLLKLAPR